MPHIHTKPGQHDHTVSIYLIRTDFNEPKVMLHFHRKAKMWAQFGGHIELEETPWQAVIHELQEESGYEMSQLDLLQPDRRIRQVGGAMVHPVPVVHATMGYPTDAAHFHTDSAYVLVANEPPRDTPGEGESKDIRLFTRDEIIANPKIDDITRDIALYSLDEILLNWQRSSPLDFS